MTKRQIAMLSLIGCTLISLPLFMGCRIDSPDSVIPSVQINVGGVYDGKLSGLLVSRNTGAPIKSMNLIQNGNSLQAVDNNGLIFRGTIGSVQGNDATFTLKGQTTAGQEGIISGTISTGDGKATMRGTWAEPSLFGNVAGEATNVPQSPPPSNGSNGSNDNNSSTNGTVSLDLGSSRTIIPAT